MNEFSGAAIGKRQTGEAWGASYLLGAGSPPTTKGGAVSDTQRQRNPVIDNDGRIFTQADLERCHQLLDDLLVTRRCDAGELLSLRFRLVVLAKSCDNGPQDEDTLTPEEISERAS